MQKPELLAPAGNVEKLKIAVKYGADAVYLGTDGYSLRAGADNFSLANLKDNVDYCHAHGVKVYLAVNIYAHNKDIVDLAEYLKKAKDCGIDAFIISDPGVFQIAKEAAPDVQIHLSTQANTTNWQSALFWAKQGVDRVVLARELSLEEIKEIKEKAAVELEGFVHGAMCISYSGRCLLSNFMVNRGANQGECAHPCRWKYTLMEEKRPGQHFPVFEDERGTYIFNSKDLCMIEHIPVLVEAGISSFKIEGRMKSVHYIGTVIQVYRKAIDRYIADPANYQADPAWLEELEKVSHRDYTTGFYFGKTDNLKQTYSHSSYVRTHDFVGLVKEHNPQSGFVTLEVRNNLKAGEEVEFFAPGLEITRITIKEMFNAENAKIEVAPHPHQLVSFYVGHNLEPDTLVRRKKGVSQ